MFQVTKNEPKFFIDTKRKVEKPNENSAWSDENIKIIRSKLASYILDEQNGLCIYCEKIVEDYPNDCHIDHFRKKDSNFFPNETLNYHNLLISCNSENRCAKYKDKHISKEDYKKFIDPVIENPEEFLEYTLFGELEPKEDLNKSDAEKARFTIDILNLNDRSLVEERKNVIVSLCYLIDELTSLEQIIVSGFKNFLTLSRWILDYKVVCKQIEGAYV